MRCAGSWLTVRARARRASEPPFVGRERPLAALNSAFEAASQGRPASVYIHGPSGIGKSALIRRFLDQPLKSGDVVVLRGRCYEHESVPYKAVDGVIDSLSHYLSALPRAHAEALMPRDVLALSRLFPVMLQVEAVAASPPQEHEIPDPFVKAYFDLMPINERLRRSEFPTIHGYLKVTLCNVHEELTKRMDAPALVASLLESPTGAQDALAP
jgi:Cdc6-like AAA superfamily ATPase